MVPSALPCAMLGPDPLGLGGPLLLEGGPVDRVAARAMVELQAENFFFFAHPLL